LRLGRGGVGFETKGHGIIHPVARRSGSRSQRSGNAVKDRLRFMTSPVGRESCQLRCNFAPTAERAEQTEQCCLKNRRM